MRFFGRIKKGKLILDNRKAFEKFLFSFKEEAIIQADIKKYYKVRSLDQNRLYWAWLNIIADEVGYDSEEMHSTFKAMFLTDRSQTLPIVRSTTKLNKLQFMNYLNKIERTASELGITLPNPDEYNKIDL